MLIEIEKKEQLYSFDALPGEKILFAGLRAGIPLPYECSSGSCGSCRARLKQGDLDEGWAQAPGRKNLKAQKQEFLMCQASATTACKLGVPSSISHFRDDDITADYHRGKLTGMGYLTADVLRFEVNLEQKVSFHAGQFFMLKVPDVDGYRAYSMVNYETNTDTLEFIIRLKPGGQYSNWVKDHAGDGDVVELFGPLGRASFHADESHDLLMIAGGSGIAGLMSILHHACQINYFANHRVQLFFGIRTWQDIFFEEQLLEMKNQFPENISIHLVASDEKPDTTPLVENAALSYSCGWVHEVALTAIAPEQGNSMVYLAGPPQLVDACLRPLIIDAKVSPNRIRYDKFS